MKKTILMALGLLMGSHLWAQTAPDVNSLGLFLAGKPDSIEKSQSSYWKQYSEKIVPSWQHYDKKQFEPIKTWSAQNLDSKEIKEVFYPFGGPDITHPLMFFPNAQKYVLIGLEPVGSLPVNINSDSDNQTKQGLSQLSSSVSEVLGRNFFITSQMNRQVKNASYTGVSSMLLFFLSSAGAEISSVTPLKMEGTNVVSSSWTGAQGVSVKFKLQGQEKEVVYFSWDISNSGFAKNHERLEWLNSNKYDVTMLKAASYLTWLGDFSQIKNIILNNSQRVLTDSSGMQYKDFSNNWTVKIYGDYTGPIGLFKGRTDNELLKAFKDEKQKQALPFFYGYNDKGIPVHLMYAIKKK